MPTNLYGPGDSYHPDNSHVLPALIRRVHEAKREGAPTVTVWGTGSPRREFLFVDDLADACVFVLEHYSGESHLNVGSDEEVTIADAAELIAEVGAQGAADYQEARLRRPDGSELPAALSARPIEYDGAPCLIIGLLDLTERHAALAEIERQREMIHQREKMGALGSLLAEVAH